jgi:hypothetical protein
MPVSSSNPNHVVSIIATTAKTHRGDVGRLALSRYRSLQPLRCCGEKTLFAGDLLLLHS